MGRNKDDWTSAVGGLLSGFSGTYFPLMEKRDERKFRQQQYDLQARQQDLLDQYHQEQLADSRSQRQFQQQELLSKAQAGYDTALREWERVKNLVGDEMAGPRPQAPAILQYGGGLMPSGGIVPGVPAAPEGSSMAAPPVASPPSIGGASPGPSSDSGTVSPESPKPKTYANIGDYTLQNSPSENAPSAPIWQRQNNPGNLRVPGQKAFQSFPDMETGLGAMYSQLDRYNQRGINTPRGIVSTYAPSNENNTEAYIGIVSKALGVGPDDPIDLSSPQQRVALGKAMTQVEGSGKALTDDMHARAAGIAPARQQAQAPTAADQQVLGIAGGTGQPQGPLFAQAGQPTMSDASGRPQAAVKRDLKYWVTQAPPEEFAKLVIAMPKQAEALAALRKQANPQEHYDLKEGADGLYRVNKATGQTSKVESFPSKDTGAFAGTGMDAQSWSVINGVAPKIQAGTASQDDLRMYTIAEAHLTAPKITTDPTTGAQTLMQLDLQQFGFPSLRKAQPQQVSQHAAPQVAQPGQVGQTPSAQGTGYTLTQTGGQKPLTANDAGKIQGANLSLGYLDDVEKRLFPNGEYDRTVMGKSYIPGAAEADLRNKIREAIGYALYLKTGAAATPKEIAEQESLYTPGLTDDSVVAKSKLDRLRSFLAAVAQGTNRAQQSPGGPGVTGPDLKSKYGLE